MFNNPYNMFSYGNQMSGMQMMPTATRMAGMGGAGFTGGSGIGRTAINASKPGFFKALAGIKWGSVLNNTQKTLNVINQAIPVYYQMKPIWGNLKSFGKIMSVFNEPDNNTNTNQINNNFSRNQANNQTRDKEKKEESTNLPTFFIN